MTTSTDSATQFAARLTAQSSINRRKAALISILIVLLTATLSACSSDEATRKSRSGRWTRIDDPTTQLASTAPVTQADQGWTV